jgi:hypothetical protein
MQEVYRSVGREKERQQSSESRGLVPEEIRGAYDQGSESADADLRYGGEIASVSSETASQERVARHGVAGKLSYRSSSVSWFSACPLRATSMDLPVSPK